MKKILVAEDDVFLANAYRVKLTKAGFEIKMTTDGVEALKAVAEFQPDLLLLDLVMPNKDGFAVLAAIKTDETWKNLPVIVASNLGQQEDIDRALKLGANGYIIKSNESLEDIITKIKQTMTESTSQTSKTVAKTVGSI